MMDSAREHNDTGVRHYLAGRLEAAEAEYRAALALDPNDSAAHNNLGFLLAQAGHWDQAVEHLQQAVDLSPGDATAQTNLGQALAGTGAIEEGLAHLVRATSLAPEDVQTWDNLGRIRLLAGDPEGAATAWSRACDLVSQDELGGLRLHRRLATALAQANRRDDAIAVLDQAIQSLHLSKDMARTEPGEQADAWSLLGTLLFLRQDYGSARAALGRALDLAPEHRDALRHLGLVQLATGETDTARLTYERLISADPDNPEARVDLAVLLLAAGDPATALHHLEAAASEREILDDTRYDFYLAVALIQAGDRNAGLARLADLSMGEDDYAHRAAEHLQTLG